MVSHSIETGFNLKYMTSERLEECVFVGGGWVGVGSNPWIGSLAYESNILILPCHTFVVGYYIFTLTYLRVCICLPHIPYFSAYKTKAFTFQNKPKNLDPSYKTDLDF